VCNYRQKQRFTTCVIRLINISDCSLTYQSFISNIYFFPFIKAVNLSTPLTVLHCFTISLRSFLYDDHSFFLQQHDRLKLFVTFFYFLVFNKVATVPSGNYQSRICWGKNGEWSLLCNLGSRSAKRATSQLSVV
jgi:hypothetical protein